MTMGIRDVTGINRSHSASGVWSAANSSTPSCVIAFMQQSLTAQMHAYVEFFQAGISRVRARVRSAWLAAVSRVPPITMT